jgi:hypothetical protein
MPLNPFAGIFQDGIFLGLYSIFYIFFEAAQRQVSTFPLSLSLL